MLAFTKSSLFWLLWTFLLTTSTAATTASTNNSIGPFQLRLHWTPGACWQGDCDGPHNGLARTTGWCWQCEGLRCNYGDLLWIEPCRQISNNGGESSMDQQLFRWIPIPTETIFAATFAAADGTKQVWGQFQVRSQERLEEDGFGSTAAEPAYITYVYCLERIQGYKYQLRECNAGRQSQWFTGLPMSGDLESEPFELHPSPKATEEDNIYAPFTANQLETTHTNCMVMHHHPRHYEEIKHTSCRDARDVETSLWEVIMQQAPFAAGFEQDSSALGSDNNNYEFDATLIRPNNNHNNNDDNDDDADVVVVVTPKEHPSFEPRDYYRLGDTREDPRCAPDATCGMCQGHCRNDSDCAGSLKCFERTSSNAFEAPPGCHGKGIARIDYCYAADGN